VAELIYGAYRSANAEKNLRLVEELTDTFISFSFDDQAAERFGQLRVMLETDGNPIGPYDLQIASIALARGLTVVTNNSGEFMRVPGLSVEDWQTDS